MRLLQFKLGTKIAFLSFCLVLLSVLVSGMAIVNRTSAAAEQEFGMRAMAIARTVAQLRDVQDNLGRPNGSQIIQPIAERIRLATGVEYIVVFDMNRIRYSHPLQDRIGTLFNDGDESAALQRNEYLSHAIGVMGPSVRAFVPVLADEGTRQVGVVTVGVLTPTISDTLRALRIQLYSALAFGIILGIGGSFYLAKNIKRAMFSLEPNEIARILEERVAIFQAMGEGVIAIDTENKITVLNAEACRITGASAEQVGMPVESVAELPGLADTLHQGQTRFNAELMINNNMVLANYLPVKVKDKIVGAVITFRDKTDVNKLAEELTGVKAFIEALRVQSHESLNKLHTIAGLIQLQKYQEAVDYIFSVTEEQQEITRFLSKRIRNASIAGLLLGKYNRSKELKVSLIFDSNSQLVSLPQGVDSGTLVIILGNLLENAMEAVAGKELREVHCSIRQEKEEIKLYVEDTGGGIPAEVQRKIFDWGFTTKGAGSRGIGLFLVNRAIKGIGGSLEIESGNWGTRFLVRIPVKAAGGVQVG